MTSVVKNNIQLVQRSTRIKRNVTTSQQKFKVTPYKLNEARENASDEDTFGLSRAFDWLRG